jgi:hypothetical protein
MSVPPLVQTDISDDGSDEDLSDEVDGVSQGSVVSMLDV